MQVHTPQARDLLHRLWDRLLVCARTRLACDSSLNHHVDTHTFTKRADARKCTPSQARSLLHKLWIEQPENYATCLATVPCYKAEHGDLFKKFQLMR